MGLKRPPLKRLALLVFIIIPLLAWVIVKPVRVIAPQLVGISCPRAVVCVENITQFQTAADLYSDALTFISAEVATIEGSPKVIFCSSEACAQSFGLGKRSAVTFGAFGTVISPRAWRPYYVRHEMIHYLEGERLGVLQLLFKPSWFVEGMAYALSLDPRSPLAEPFEGYRKQFLSWYASIDKRALWIEARKL
jgi:hypothetical protein